MLGLVGLAGLSGVVWQWRQAEHARRLTLIQVESERQARLRADRPG